MNNRIVFTGGPGSGKTSVINFLKLLGYQNVTEVGRKVIQTQIKQDGEALPWKNTMAFRDEMVLAEMHNYRVHDDSVMVFYDRSVIDCYGYSQLEQIAISDILLRCCLEFTYQKRVFIFPPWKEIYENDNERKQDFNKAVATYLAMESAYKKFGYELVEVPKTSVSERAAFILDMVVND